MLELHWLGLRRDSPSDHPPFVPSLWDFKLEFIITIRPSSDLINAVQACIPTTKRPSRKLHWWEHAAQAYQRKGNPKYLRKGSYHRIKCITAAFLAAFMWRRPLNSTVLATATHRKLKNVSDGISTQVIAQMINKCRIKMVQKKLYNVRDLPRRGDRKNSKRDTVAL